MNFEEILEERRETVTQSIRPITSDEAHALGESLFPIIGDPWRDMFFEFLSEHPEATLHHANLPDGAQLLYSRTQNRGIWYIPGTAKGIIQERGLTILSQILDDAV